MPLTRFVFVGIFLFSLSLGAQSDKDTQASRHYRVAQEALKDGNLEIAYTELKEAQDLAPSNALIKYYLAVVLSKNTDVMNRDPDAALSWLESAMKIGLPPKESASADELLASIQYAIRKKESASRKAELEVSGSDWIVGTWIAADTETREPVKNFYGEIFSERTRTTRIQIVSRTDDPRKFRWIFRITAIIELEASDGNHSDRYYTHLDTMKEFREIRGTAIYEGLLSVDEHGGITSSDRFFSGCERRCDTSKTPRAECFADKYAGGDLYTKVNDTALRVTFVDGSGFRDYRKR